MADGRWMLFVDGENFTIRAQELFGDLMDFPAMDKFHMKDTFLWLPKTTNAMKGTSINLDYSPLDFDDFSVRSYYYTAVQGDSDLVSEVEMALRGFSFSPSVFKKQKGRSSKGVDISLTVNALHHAQQDHYDQAVFIAGDKDYIPLFDAIKRLGKRVFVIFFEQLTPDEIRLTVDGFVDLTAILKDRIGWLRIKSKVDQ